MKNWANLYEVISGTEHVTLGSIKFGLAKGMLNWTFNVENDFENYLLRQTSNSNDFNPFFAKFWQDYMNCHLAKHYSYHRQECWTGMSIGQPREGRMSLQQDWLDTEDVVAKRIAMAGLLFAYGIKDAIFDNCFKKNLTECAMMIFISAQGRKLLFQHMESALIPRNIHSTVRDLKLWDMYGNGVPSYTVYNIIDVGTNTASYQKVFEIKNGTFHKQGQPIFYTGSSKSFQYNEPLCSHDPECIAKPIDTEELTQQVEDGAGFVPFASPPWMLPMMVCILVVLSLCLMTMLVYVINKHSVSKQGE